MTKTLSPQLTRDTSMDIPEDEEYEVPGNLWPDEGTGFDDILHIINPQGLYQKRFLYAILCPISIISALIMCNVYIFYIPDHWCYDPNRTSYNYSSHEEWKNNTIPREIGQDGIEAYSKCEMYADESRTTKMNCPYGWEYDKSELSMTIPSEFDWVCEKQEYTTIVFTATGISAILGTVLIGPAVDRYGRKIFLIGFTLLGVFLDTTLLFLPKYFEVYVALSMVSCLVSMNPDIILQELSDSEFRSWTSATTYTIYVLGLSAVPLIAYLVGNWFYIGIIIVLSKILTFIYFLYIPESPRWLTSVGKIEEAKKIIKDVARVNNTIKKLTDEHLHNSLKNIATQSEIQKNEIKSSGLRGYWTLLSYPRIARNTFLLAISGAASSVVYSGITLNAPYMPGNQFLAFFLLSIIEVPSSIAGGYLMQTVGRRWTPVIFYTLSAFACLMAAWAISVEVVVTVCIIISKFAINLTSLVEGVQEVELFPTPLRATGGSLVRFFGQIISLAMPFIVNMGRSDARIPYIGFGLFSIGGLFASLFLPETLHQNLPETVGGANDFGKDHKFCSLRPSKPSQMRKFFPVSSIRRIHPEIGMGRARTRRESVVSYVSQVHPTSIRRRRPSVIGYVGV